MGEPAITLFDGNDHEIDLQAAAAIRQSLSPDRSSKLVRARPVGGAGSSIYGDMLDPREPNKKLSGENWRGSSTKTGVVEKMIRDPHVRKSLATVVGNLLQGLWDIEPAKVGEEDQAEADEIADYARWNILELLDWTQILTDQLRFLKDGFSLLEYTDDTVEIPQSRFPRHPGRDLGVVYTAFIHRPAWTIPDDGWIQSAQDPTTLDAVRQRISGSDVEEATDIVIPMSRVLRATQDQEGGEFEGMAQLRSAHAAWKAKVLLTIVEMILHERTGAGVPTIELPEKVPEDEQSLAREILQELRANEKGYLLLPNGYKFDWNTTSGGPAPALAAAIERCNRDIAHNLGAAFMLLGSATSTGSRALAQTQRSQFQIDQEVWGHIIVRLWNRGSDGWAPIQSLVRKNYGDRAARMFCPHLVVRNLPSREWAGVLPILHNLVAAGVIVPDDKLELWARRNLYAPMADKETEREVKGNQGAGPPAQAAPPSEPEGDQASAAMIESLFARMEGTLEGLAARMVSVESAMRAA